MSSFKDGVKKYAAAILPTAIYFSDAGMDSISSYDFCTDGQIWWCALSASFIIVPELIVSAFIAYKIWRDRHKKGAQAKKEDFAILSRVPNHALTTAITVFFFLMVPTMVLPFLMLPWLTYKALQDGNGSIDSASLIRKTQLTMIQLKGMEALLQAGPQLSLKSYIVIHKIHCIQGNGLYNETTLMNVTVAGDTSQDLQEYCKDVWDMDTSAREVGTLDVLSPFGSLCSLCFSIACLVIDEHNDDWYRKTVWFIALLGSIGSRMIVCGVLASWHQALWLVPPVTACVIVLVAKKLRYKLQQKEFGPKEALKDVLEQGLLLSYPSPEGILASASYIGWTVWFYINGTLIDGGTNVALGLEALATCIVGQAMCLVLSFIALRLGYETPDLLPVGMTSNTRTENPQQGIENSLGGVENISMNQV